MSHRPSAARRTHLVALLVVLTTLVMALPAQAAPPTPGGRVDAQSVTLPADANVVAEVTPAAKADPDANLQSTLAQVADAWAAGDRERLGAFRGERFLDVDQGTATVIVEMSTDPQVQRGAVELEVVTLADGRKVTIDHGPRVTVRADLQAAFERIGARIETAYGKSVQVSAPFAALRALARLAGVANVRLPFPAQEDALPARQQLSAVMGPQAPTVGTPTVGAQTTEGVGVTRTNLWQASPFNYSGAGINLAVFDFGFTGWDVRQTNGDLPAGVNLVLKDFSASYDFGPPGTTGNEHGTSCAEIAYDMAPGAKVYLYAFSTDAEFQNAVADYINNVTGKRVVTMSVGWVNAGPYDGTGSIDTAINNATAAGIFWANSAGNYQRQHWSGTSVQYSTGNTIAFGTGNLNLLGPSVGYVWNIPSGTNIRFFLEWNDWNAGRTGNQNHVDYDLVLYKYNGSGWASVASSATRQCTGTATPTEAISFTTSSGTNPYYAIGIQRYNSGCANNFGHWMQLYTFNGFYTSGTGTDYAFNYSNVCNSLSIPSEADGAVAVAADFWNEDTDSTYDYGLETFSSFGPRSASGGVNPGTTVNKPDVAAPDGVSTATSGASNGQPWRTLGSTGFWGTSAASPHVAGMAAMMWQIWPSYTLAQLKAAMFSQAAGKGSGGTCGGAAPTVAAPGGMTPMSNTQNNRYGWGRIDLGQPSPAAVDLAGFHGEVVAGQPVLTWETVSETDHAGFNLYRGASENGPWVKVNDSLIASAAPGSAEGHAYTWTDANAAPAAAHWYMLEDVALNGQTTAHGPVRIELNDPNAVNVRAFTAQPDWAQYDWLARLKALFGLK